MGLREGSLRALTRGTPAAPSRARVAFRGHGTRPVLPAGSFSLHTGESGDPAALRTREPSGSSGTCDLGDGSSQSRSWSGYSFAHWAPAAQQTRGFRRCWGSDWSPELLGTRCSRYRSSRLAPGDGSKATARPAEPTALPLRGLAGAFPPPMGRAFPSPVLGLGLLGPSWAGSPLRSPLPSSVRGQATPARFQKRAPARVPALR